jgi:uncharacterized protein with HEPN domain
MTQHNDTIRLRHMLDHAQEAVAMVAGKDRSDLHRNRVLELALVRNDLPPLIAELEKVLQTIDRK